MKPRKKNHEIKQASQLSMRLSNFSAAQNTTLALCIPSLLAASYSHAEEAVVLDTLQIEERTLDTNPYAEKGAPYKAKTSGDTRRVKPLAETPQTVSVLTQTAIQESGDTDLRAILAKQPGITLGTGENGNAFGDRYVIRGHEARSDVFVDGLRDPGMTVRESFAVEQVEITKGPSSTFAGRGSTGGAVNSITKQANTEYNFNKVQAAVGTDDFHRLTLDSNVKVNDDAALRVNLLHAFQEIPDRASAERERNGVALSGVLQASDKLSLAADYYYLKAADKPDLGSYIDRNTGKPVTDIPTYLQDDDFLESEVGTFTFRAEYAFSENVRLNNATRYGATENGYVATGASGRTRDASDPAGAIPTVSLSTHQGWQEVEYFANMTNVFWGSELAGRNNQFVFTLETSSLNVLNGTYGANGTADSNCELPGRGSNPPSGGYCIVDTEGNYLSNISSLMQRNVVKGRWDSDYSIDTTSLAVMDTIDLTKDWSLFIGLRADYFDYSNKVLGRGATEPTLFEYSDILWNGHIGVVYDIQEDANVYLTYSTSANINGGESDVGGSCGYGGLCGDPTQVGDSAPEKTENLELGTKWNLMNEKLLATAAIFQITKNDVMESVGDDYAALGTLNTGKNRVQGIEFSLTGNLTDKLSTQAGVAFMNAEVLESYTAENTGKTLANFSDDSLFLQLRYQVTEELSFGGNATYASEVYTGQPDTAANEELGVPSYTVYNLFATYMFSSKLSARLNVGNVTDEDYYLTAYRSGAFAYIGDRQNAQLTVAYEF